VRGSSRFFFKNLYGKSLAYFLLPELSADWAAQRIRAFALGTDPHIMRSFQKYSGFHEPGSENFDPSRFDTHVLGPECSGKRLPGELVAQGGEVIQDRRVICLTYLREPGHSWQVETRDSLGALETYSAEHGHSLRADPRIDERNIASPQTRDLGRNLKVPGLSHRPCLIVKDRAALY